MGNTLKVQQKLPTKFINICCNWMWVVHTPFVAALQAKPIIFVVLLGKYPPLVNQTKDGLTKWVLVSGWRHAKTVDASNNPFRWYALVKQLSESQACMTFSAVKLCLIREAYHLANQTSIVETRSSTELRLHNTAQHSWRNLTTRSPIRNSNRKLGNWLWEGIALAK